MQLLEQLRSDHSKPLAAPNDRMLPQSPATCRPALRWHSRARTVSSADAPPPPHGMEDPDLTDAGGGYVSALPGAASFDSAFSFALFRGGHVAMTVLGGLQVDEAGRLADWMVPGKLVPGMGRAMDLVAGARRVIVAMLHNVRGCSKIVPVLTLPATSARRVSLVVTDLAVIEPTPEGLVLRERAPGVTVAAIIAATAARLVMPPDGAVPEMQL